MRLWGGRFRKPTDPALERLGRSIGFDRRFIPQEIRIHRVYGRALERAGRITSSERVLIEQGLDEVERKLTLEPPSFAASDEDIHTAVERLLAECIGPVAGKLPMGRSRNDLAATDFRLYLAEAIVELVGELRRLQATLLSRAGETRDMVMPGYTHMRRAQPVVFGQYLLCSFWALERDRGRLLRAKACCLELPLGAGALAGNPMGVDREAMAEELGSSGVVENSIDAVSSRDFALELLAGLAILGTQLSRMSEDLILWSSPEFGFIALDEGFSTGSSLMPQKRNPDGLELIRGKTGRLVGNLMSLLTTVKGLPTGYQRDLQEDKEPVFDSLDSMRLILPVMDGTVATMTVHPDGMERALSSDLLATDLADYLVNKGVPFRESHRVVGEILSLAAERGADPSELTLDTLRRFSGAFDEEVRSVWSYRASVDRRVSRGGVAPGAMEQQLQLAAQALGMSD